MFHSIVLLILFFSVASSAGAFDYRDFTHLTESKKEGTDFKITEERRSSPVLVLAIHAGNIEPVTGDLARLIAARDHSLYLFEGLLPEGTAFKETHLTSSKFDEPRALALAKDSELCISLHGFTAKDPKSDEVCIGGGNTKAASAIALALQKEFPLLQVENPCAKFPGVQPTNIVNRCGDAGVQLEMSRHLRDELSANPKEADKFATVIRSAISTP